MHLLKFQVCLGYTFTPATLTLFNKMSIGFEATSVGRGQIKLTENVSSKTRTRNLAKFLTDQLSQNPVF
jgi:hypothetical protein